VITGIGLPSAKGRRADCGPTCGFQRRGTVSQDRSRGREPQGNFAQPAGRRREARRCHRVQFMPATIETRPSRSALRWLVMTSMAPVPCRLKPGEDRAFERKGLIDPWRIGNIFEDQMSELPTQCQAFGESGSGQRALQQFSDRGISCDDES
jgi:hypothetical protein